MRLKRLLSTARLPEIKNAQLRNFEAGSKDREALISAVKEMLHTTHIAPCVVNGKEHFVKSESGSQLNCGHHKHVFCNFGMATPDLVKEAISGAVHAQQAWSRMPFEDRAAVFLKAADLIDTKYWPQLMAATMVGQGKNAWQAEIDSHAELVDFFRFNCKFAEDIHSGAIGSGLGSPAGTWNRLEFRPLEGFVAAISPFNFTAIGGNLPAAPALMGNAVLWKPSSSAVYSNYLIYRILCEAGLPPGVIQFIPGPAGQVAEAMLTHPDFAGLHYTGSTAVFQSLWRRIAANLEAYKAFPRIVGETGGKNVHFVHPSADPQNVINQTIRAAFEYQGQKCSACSRLYVPESLWPHIKEGLVEAVKSIRQGDASDFTAFAGPVINKAAFDKITGYIKLAKEANHRETKIIAGGHYDDSTGYFIQPTIIETSNHDFKTVKEEIFGPVLTAFVYSDNKFEETLSLVNDTSSYALTAAIFANDRVAIRKASDILLNAAGNLYINDKCTGAVVNQQPFGGARKSGTNDKAGSALNLLRWVSPRSIKEAFTSLEDWRYPSNS